MSTRLPNYILYKMRKVARYPNGCLLNNIFNPNVSVGDAREVSRIPIKHAFKS